MVFLRLALFTAVFFAVILFLAVATEFLFFRAGDERWRSYRDILPFTVQLSHRVDYGANFVTSLGRGNNHSFF
jgi:hypothetical protein